MTTSNHKRLVLAGPIEVRPEILQAQAAWSIGHRSPEFAELFASLQEKLKRAFVTQNRVYVSGSSGSGLWEAAIRCSVRNDRKVLHLTNGSFSERWAQVSEANGKQVDVIAVDWGKPHTPEMVADAMHKQRYDAVCVVHNETSTGVTNPIQAIGEVVRQYEDTLFLVDSVSGFLGMELFVDDWGIDVALTSSQKAFALPPGIAFAAVSDRVLERAKQIEHRGYYFDFIQMEKYIVKNNTVSTPPVALMYAANQQLEDIFANGGLEARWQRHTQLRDRTHEWAIAAGFGLFAQEGYRSKTVSCIANTRGIDVNDMAAFMSERGFGMDKGYGKIRGETFRIGHMGDMDADFLEDVLSNFDDFLKL